MDLGARKWQEAGGKHIMSFIVCQILLGSLK